MTAKHTPPPWLVTEHYEKWNGLAIHRVSTADDRSIARASKADAAHIVKCVNAHDELVAALQDIVNAHESGHGEDVMGTIARSALAKVKP